MFDIESYFVEEGAGDDAGRSVDRVLRLDCSDRQCTGHYSPAAGATQVDGVGEGSAI